MRALATTVLANAFVRMFPAASLRANILKQLAMFCGSVLFVWLLALTYGLDLSIGFF